jgi:hypothetical protein
MQIAMHTKNPMDRIQVKSPPAAQHSSQAKPYTVKAWCWIHTFTFAVHNVSLTPRMVGAATGLDKAKNRHQNERIAG